MPDNLMTIQLTQGKIAIVSKEDFDKVAKFKWHAQHACGHWYAVRTVRIGRKFKAILMHRVIMDAPSGMEVDHKDGDGLNNLRSNLRIATKAQNRANSRYSTASSGYKGVMFIARKWQASIKPHGKQIYLGRFKTRQEAAAAYNEAAKLHYGEFAVLNDLSTGDKRHAG